LSPRLASEIPCQAQRFTNSGKQVTCLVTKLTNNPFWTNFKGRCGNPQEEDSRQRVHAGLASSDNDLPTQLVHCLRQRLNAMPLVVATGLGKKGKVNVKEGLRRGSPDCPKHMGGLEIQQLRISFHSEDHRGTLASTTDQHRVGK
jgi:hypothetical protein